MGFIFDANSISFFLSLLFALLALIFGILKYKSFHYRIIVNVIIAYFLGSTIFPGLSILYYSSQNQTLMRESLEGYRNFFGISGLLLILVAIYSMYEMLKYDKKVKKNKSLKS